ncbi:hypothetical protein Poly30_43400 [Planctomycetes bacterium Poly30]|uniref:Carboxypeptidase regulatory-like domain-containing protein n=1 Tax=Saltatorellus ferox TaxID=2528018 RepID=A0A518EXH2_9BACT|nr:hypothetical protein Poly30_43400 [Planctomycetes bacterium Poly30]
MDEVEFLTDGSGQYAIPDVPVSHPPRLQIFKAGFVEFFEPIEGLIEPETEWNVGLRRGSAALITVRDRQSGAPIAGVELRREDRAPLGVTDALGQLELRVESGQEICLVASREGHVGLTWWCTIHDVEEAASIVLPMTAFGWVDVRVIDETGLLTPCAQVGAWFEDGRLGDEHPERSDDPEAGYPGQIRHTLAWDLASTTALEGTCTLPVHPSDDPQIVSATREDGSRARSVPFFVREPGARTRVVVTFLPVGSVEGVVRYNGEPMARALVTLTLVDGETLRVGSDHQGHYHAKDVPPGEVLVQLDQRNGNTRPAPQPVEVVAGATATQDIDWIEELVTMRGSVVCFDGSPAVGCHVRALRSNAYGWSESFTATTDETGAFSLQTRAGDPYTVSAKHEGVRIARDGVAPDDPSLELVLDASGWIRARFTDAEMNAPISLERGAEHTSIAWSTDAVDAYRWSLGSGKALPDDTFLLQVAARSPSSTASLCVHFADQGYRPTTVSGIALGATESEATPVEILLARGFEAKLSFQGPEPMTNERRGLRRWFVLREDQADFVRGPFPDRSGASNMRIGKVNMWLESPTLMNQMPGFDDPGVAHVSGLAPAGTPFARSRTTSPSSPSGSSCPKWIQRSRLHGASADREPRGCPSPPG